MEAVCFHCLSSLDLFKLPGSARHQPVPYAPDVPTCRFVHEVAHLRAGQRVVLDIENNVPVHGHGDPRRARAKQDRTQQHLDHLTGVVASIAEATRRNSEDIDVLVKLVGGIVEGGNGKSGS